MAIDRADPDRGQRPQKGHGRNTQRRAGTIHGQDIAIGLAIAGEYKILNLHFVRKTLGKHGPNRPINQPGREGLLHGRAAFALEKTTGKLTRRGMPLPVVAHQRKEIDARARATGGCCTEHHGIAILHQDTASSLFSKYTRFQRKSTLTNFFLYSNFVSIQFTVPFFLISFFLLQPSTFFLIYFDHVRFLGCSSPKARKSCCKSHGQP